MTLETWADETRQAIQDEQSDKLRTELEQLPCGHAVGCLRDYGDAGYLCYVCEAEENMKTYQLCIEQLRGKCIEMRAALEWITDCWGRDEDNYCRADMQSAIDNGRQILASSPLSEKYAAVVRLSTKLRDAMKATEASSGMSSWSLVDRENCLYEEWKTAVDALQEATE